MVCLIKSGYYIVPGPSTALIIGKSVVLLSDNEDSRGEAPFFSDGDPSDEDEISGDFSIIFH